MKSIIELNKEIDSLILEIKTLEDTEDKKHFRKAKQLRKRVAYLRYILLYLESLPSEEYLKKEKEKMSNRIGLLMLNYQPLDERFTKAQVSKHKKNHEKEMGVTKIKDQLKTIDFLISK